MHSSTIALVVTGALVAASGALVATLLARDDPGADPAHWVTETLPTDGSGLLPHALHVTPADCPGFTLSSPVPEESRNVPGSGSYTVTLDGGHYALWICLGTVEEVGGARDAVADRLGVDGDSRSVNPVLVSAPFGEAVRVDLAFGPDAVPRVTDWLVDHGGHTYAFGYLHPSGDQRHYKDVEAMIASVIWDE